MKVIYKCSFCEKEIISPKEDENLMFFCSDHFKYICKNCAKVVGKCAECGKVPCKACNFHFEKKYCHSCLEKLFIKSLEQEYSKELIETLIFFYKGYLY
jgi:hypothetical protein